MVGSHTLDGPGLSPPLATVVAAMRAGRLALLFVEEGETRGDLILAADHVSPDLLNTILKEARGLLCLAIAERGYQRLQLRSEPIPPVSRNPRAPRVATTIEATRGVSTGISSADRTQTIRTAISADVAPGDVRQPGHVPLLRAAPGGVGERPAPTEAAVDLCALAGLTPAAVVCDVLGPDGEMANRAHLESVAAACDALVVPVKSVAAQLGGKR